MRSAQISQVFVYIMSGIIIIAVLGFGVKMLFDVINTSEEIACLKFKEKLSRTIAGDMGYGTVDNITLQVDCDFRKICFISDPYAEGASSPDIDSSVYPLIKDSWDEYVRQNVFFVNTVSEDFYYVENLVVDGHVCQEITGAGVPITLKGKGNHVVLSLPN